VSDYRDDRSAMRQRIEALEAELERATERNEDLEEDLRLLRLEESDALAETTKPHAGGSTSTSADKRQIAALVIGGATIICVGMALTTWDRDAQRATATAQPTPKNSPVPSQRATPTPVQPRVASATCRCLDAKGRSVRLAYRPSAVMSMGGNMTYSLDVALEADNRDPELPLELDTVPPSELKGGDSRFAMACGADRMVLAFRQHATAWSLEDGTRLWSVSLPGAGAVGQGKNGPLRIECDTLESRDGVVTIPRADGKARLALENGSPIKTSGGR
jgi:hypothetical protein